MAMAPFTKWPAGRMHGASFTTSMSCTHPHNNRALARIGALYAIEEEIRGKPADPAERPPGARQATAG